MFFSQSNEYSYSLIDKEVGSESRYLLLAGSIDRELSTDSSSQLLPLYVLMLVPLDLVLETFTGSGCQDEQALAL